MSEPSPEMPMSNELMQSPHAMTLPVLSQELKDIAFTDPKYAAGTRISKGTSARWTTVEGIQYDIKADTVRALLDGGAIGHMSILSLLVEYELGTPTPPAELTQLVTDYEDEMPSQPTISSIAVQHEVTFTISARNTLGWQANRTYTITHEVTEAELEDGEEVDEPDLDQEADSDAQYIMTIMRESSYTHTLANVFPAASPRTLKAGDAIEDVDAMFLAMEEEVRTLEAQKVFEMLVFEEEDGFDLLTVLPREAVEEIEMIRKKIQDGTE